MLFSNKWLPVLLGDARSFQRSRCGLKHQSGYCWQRQLELGSGILHRVPHIGSDSVVPDEKHKQPELSSYPQIYLVSLFPSVSNKIGVGVGEAVIDNMMESVFVSQNNQIFTKNLGPLCLLSESVVESRLWNQC